MRTSTSTKEKMADALRQRMREAPIEKISVKSITDQCGLNRQTFYYHFKDIYDLAQWMYLQDVRKALKKSFRYDDWSEALKVFLKAMDEDTECLQALFLSSGYYTSFRLEFSEIVHTMLIPLIEKKLGGFSEIDEEYRDFLSRMYALVLFEYIERRARGLAFSNDASFVECWTRSLEEQRLGMVAMKS